ncbi:hypothetical protein XH99_22915 [Bradyrhizobium nanningense]|uniref:Beta-glucuronidase C-terminal domain-containing protein n=1 Tax=Bradyrhizobium nanningense TaxID=1325118 RepID=A0A4Q0S0P9_9BRAD|nr:hypothetical protein XH99_22915 [Bradyrhizobium nanningense]RXH28905.1 hypothetical protein XH84_24610 [Bradyrhizobium nanningense]
MGFALLFGATSLGAGDGADMITPARMKVSGTIDARFQSYNVEMVEVTGGRFWKPYAQKDMRRDRYAYRPPVDLSNQRLRRLAAALGPAYMRVSGTWANATFFADNDAAESAPPAGFNGVLTRAQWRGVVDFARAVDAEIVTSFAVSPGSRGPDGAWRPAQAQRLIDETRQLGGRIAAVEFMNEPTLAAINGPPPGYDAMAYGRDFNIFRDWIRRSAPETLIAGPGSASESASSSSGIRTRDLLAATGPGLDRVSYHHYNTLSARCGTHDDPVQALSEDWLSRTDATLNIYRRLRDAFEPGKPIWLTETANAACGGNMWDATFLDTFRYLDQLGRLAKAGVQVVMHNTLAASDYGLLDERTFRPRPNYWGALLWRRLMGSTVLDPDVASTAGLHVYAHCHAATKGAASVLLINTSRHKSRSVTLAVSAARYTLRADHLQDISVQLNGKSLSLSDDDDLPRFEARATAAGRVRLPPASITFLVMPGAAACR